MLADVGEHSKAVVVILLSGPSARGHGRTCRRQSHGRRPGGPGTEGGSGIADVLFGDFPVRRARPRRLMASRAGTQLPNNVNQRNGQNRRCDAPLFPFGYGLAYGEVNA
ncbi:MAG: hypothetical protein M0C28_34635 [Candidatus Moduliflexus flocculans]|nr:hypothetical protein [Candidatus Moduliflexus flocculans]